MSAQLPGTDVVIVGMGAAGGMAAYVLTAAGLEVVGIEAGPRLTNEDFLPKLDELGTYAYHNWMGESKVNHEDPTWRLDANSPTQPLPPGSIRMMNAVGGTSIHWGAQSYRFRADDFQVRSTTIERYGESALLPGTAVADWPLTYDDLEPFYDRTEHTLGVSGEAGVNPFESPRSRDFPMPATQPFEYGSLAAEAMRNLGYHPFTLPAGLTTDSFNGRPACSYCGFCSGFGCWNDSKTSAHVSVIPDAEATGLLEIRPNCRVMRILTNGNGNASGVEYLDEHGALREQPASVVIVATYAYENTRLLLLSASEDFPMGLANQSGQVGKYFLTHSAVGAQGVFPGSRQALWSGTSGQGVSIDDLNGDNFDHTGLGFIRGGVTSVTAGGESPIGISRAVPPGTPTWGSDYKEWLRENSGSIAGTFLQLETLPYEGNFLDLDPVQTDRIGVPVVRITYNLGENERLAGEYLAPKLEEILAEMGATQTWSFQPTPSPQYSHAYGGTRMGDDPSTSVVDKHGRAHEVPNLVVLGASTFPNPSGYNPTETVFAHSWYAADYIAQNFEDIAV